MMRKLIFSGTALLLMSCKMLAQTPQKEKQACAVFHGGAAHTGIYPGNNLNGPAVLKWRYKTGGRIFSSPVLHGGLLFIGSSDKNLYALRAADGQVRWKFTTGGAVSSTPATDGKTVYFGSMDGNYYAVDAATGQLRWKFATGGEHQLGGKGYGGMKPAGLYMNDLWDFFLSSPVLQQSGKSSIVFFGSSDGNVYALNAKDGRLKWKFATRGMVHSGPALYRGVLYVGGWDTYLYAIDAETGKEKWRFKTGNEPFMSGIEASPAVKDGVVYFGARDAHVYALRADNGEKLWSHETSHSWVLTTPAVADGVVYAGTSDTFLMLALDAKSGTEKWQFKTNGYAYSSPAVAGGALVFGDFTGKLYVLNIASKGKKYLFYATPERASYATEVLKNDTLNFAAAAHGADLYQYKTNVDVMNSFYKLGSIVSSPAVQDDTVFFGASDGCVYAVSFGATSGRHPAM